MDKRGELQSTLRIDDVPTVRSMVAQKLREAIMSGTLKPGQRLIERELCEMTGVSRPSIREALRLLEADGRLSIDAVRPTMVMIPALSYNQDHEALYRAGMTATRPGAEGEKYTVPFVLAYDNTSLFWAPEQQRFHPTLYVDVSRFLDVKIEALRMHASQVRAPLYHGSPEGLELATRVRGREVGVEAAEGFVQLRGVL